MRADTIEQFFLALQAHASADLRPALVDEGGAWSYRRLLTAVETQAHDFSQNGSRVVATLLDNGARWIVSDLAAMRAGVVHVPLPTFFAPAQIAHACLSAGVDTVVTLPRGAKALEALGFAAVPGGEHPDGSVSCMRRTRSPELPEGTSKISFTSGTTGTPKGACLGAEVMLSVAASIGQATQRLGITRHLCALPLAVLLENVAGILAPLAHGGTCVVLPVSRLGLLGSSTFDPQELHRAVLQHAAHSLILLPQMLRAWTAWLGGASETAPCSLELVAVGGAAVGARTLAAARELGLPAYEGYGLTEGASVQTLNLPGADCPGSVGRPLPHARVRIAGDGEIEIGGSLFLGYVGEARSERQWLPTGDLGRIDADGFLHVSGRRKNVLITAFGRNVSPEWVETALRSEPSIAQAVVFGDGAPALRAVLWPVHPEATDAELIAAITSANGHLPDYAQIQTWTRAEAPFDAAHGMATANGRPRREAILSRHACASFRGLDPAHADGDVRTQTPQSGFFQRLQQATEADRLALTGVPIVQACLRGEGSLESYVAFLTQAWHHVRHTVPLLTACRDRLPPRLHWLRPAMNEYIDEENGHDAWILSDIAACGIDSEAIRHGEPGFAADVMVAYAYDLIARRNPVGFFGMVHVLEGTSVALALMAADRIQARLGLPDSAFSYLRSHGMLDREHTAHFALLMDRLDAPEDQDAVIQAAQRFYRLYANVYRELPFAAAPESALEGAT